MHRLLIAAVVLGVFSVRNPVFARSASAGATPVDSSGAVLPGATPDPEGASTGDDREREPSPPQTVPATRLGPVLPEDIRLLGPLIPPNALTDWAASERLRAFGWAEGGYTASSTGSGLLNIAPTMNRFGNSWLFNQGALVLERTLTTDWSWGFRAEFYMGSDTAFLRPVNGFGPTGERFGTDFRQAYVSFHAPVLTEGGVDVKLGRQYVPIGYETTMAPYRPLYSLSYVWKYAQNGATTGAIATAHVNPQLDVIGGVTLGVNSLFELRGRAPDYIVRGLYWLDPGHQTQLVGTLYTGPLPIAPVKGHIGNWMTLIEVHVSHDVSQHLTLVSESNFGLETQDPGNGGKTSQWYGTAGYAIVHVNPRLDINFRAEWFDDVNGARTGTPANYIEVTPGLNIMPTPWLNFLPEIRWDHATRFVFGPEASASRHNNQWTFAIATLLKF